MVDRLDPVEISIALVTEPVAGETLLPATDQPRFSWEIVGRSGGAIRWQRYLTSNQSDIPPRALRSKGMLFVGMEQGLFVLEPRSGSTLAEYQDLTFFQAFHPLRSGVFLVLAETEILAFEEGAHLLWRESFPEIIEDVEDQGESALIKDMSSNEYQVDVRTGKLRNAK